MNPPNDEECPSDQTGAAHLTNDAAIAPFVTVEDNSANPVSSNDIPFPDDALLGWLREAQPCAVAAVTYAEAGYAVFPLAPGDKPPLTSNGFKDATTDLAQVCAWWEKWPDANIGWALPPTIVCIDVDPRNGGVGTRNLLEAQHGSLPPTKEHITGGDDGTGCGRHRFYRIDGIDPASLRGKLGPGVDVKHLGGYVVLPPSVHPSGRRYVDATPGIAPVPLPRPWRAAVVKAAPTVPVRPVIPAREAGASRKRSYALTGLANELRALANTAEGGRNVQLNTSAFKCARFVHDNLLTADEVVPLFRQTALATGLPELEVERTIRSAFSGAEAKGLSTEIPDREGYGPAKQMEVES